MVAGDGTHRMPATVFTGEQSVPSAESKNGLGRSEISPSSLLYTYRFSRVPLPSPGNGNPLELLDTDEALDVESLPPNPPAPVDVDDGSGRIGGFEVHEMASAAIDARTYFMLLLWLSGVV